MHEFLSSEIGSLWIPTQYRVLDLGSEWISCLIAKTYLWSQWICRQTVRVDPWSERIRDPDPWDQIPGSVFGIHGHICWYVLVSWRIAIEILLLHIWEQVLICFFYLFDKLSTRSYICIFIEGQKTLLSKIRKTLGIQKELVSFCHARGENRTDLTSFLF